MEYGMDPAVKARLSSCQDQIREHTTTWDLNSFLIKPVQRILKWVCALAMLMSGECCCCSICY